MPYERWYKMLYEPEDAYQWFSRFRKLPPGDRRLNLLVERHQGTFTELVEWAALYKWDERALAYDIHRESKSLALIEDRQDQIIEQGYYGLQKLHNLIMQGIEGFDLLKTEDVEEIPDPDPDYDGQMMRVVTRAPNIRGLRTLASTFIDVDRQMRLNVGLATSFTSKQVEHGGMIVERKISSLEIKFTKDNPDNAGFVSDRYDDIIVGDVERPALEDGKVDDESDTSEV